MNDKDIFGVNKLKEVTIVISLSIVYVCARSFKIEEFSIVYIFPIVPHCLAYNSHNFYVMELKFCQKFGFGTFYRSVA